jgi:FkbM family methyltransferase
MNVATQSDQEDPRGQLARLFQRMMEDYRPIELGEAVNPVDAFFCYRMLLGRMPSADVELPNLLSLGEFPYREFLNSVLNSSEFSGHGAFMPGGHRFMAELPLFRFWFRTEDREMGSLMGMGQYEPETISLLPKLVQAGDLCMDIGAQTGFISMHLATLVGSAGHVYAMEPMQDSFDILTKNVDENRFHSVITAQHLACSDHSGEQHFIQRSGMLIATEGNEAGEVISIRSVRADDVPKGRVSFVKLDVEGHEPTVLKGMPRILNKDRPIILTEVNEFWLRRAGSSGPDYLRQLTEFGYALRRTEDGSSIDPAHVSFGALDSMNVLAIPTERDEQVSKMICAE